jgi:hypothetical protein
MKLADTSTKMAILLVKLIALSVLLPSPRGNRTVVLAKSQRRHFFKFFLYVARGSQRRYDRGTCSPVGDRYRQGPLRYLVLNR